MASSSRDSSSHSRSDTVGSAEVAACLERLAAGDLTARDRIIELCGNRLRILAHRMLSAFPNVRRWDDTDDVFQNAVMRLHRTLGQVPISSPRQITALAATELHRELLDLARKHAGRMSFAANHATNLPGSDGRAGDVRPPVIGDMAVPQESLDRWTQFHNAILNLPSDLREVFHLVWYLDADQRTIAHLTACSERTVRTRWLEARKAIRTALDGQRPM
jgi:RNA polymerase sigma-70 factor (ECF subfamily)